jgi:hypothetical protein
MLQHVSMLIPVLAAAYEPLGQRFRGYLAEWAGISLAPLFCFPEPELEL